MPGPTAVAVVVDLARDGVSVDAPLYGEPAAAAGGAEAGALDCGRPPGWVEYTVQAGDTLGPVHADGHRGGHVDARELPVERYDLRRPTAVHGALPGQAGVPVGVWPPAYDPGKLTGRRSVARHAGPVVRRGAALADEGRGPLPTLASLPFPTTWKTPPPPAPAPGDVGGDWRARRR
ncbi:MAG: hypothetical protein U0470_09835 [Anaerolineae bacterium]